ncbi:MAG TPA: hypothetical protein VLG67_05480 [Candidatus Saccharimonadales bacterium]|nr:hypothetical protein [Candidatus Saccharimonadales bacterium]
MSRKQFLLRLGLMLFLFTGISGIIKKFSDPDSFNHHQKQSNSFGGGSYGGKGKS